MRCTFSTLDVSKCLRVMLSPRGRNRLLKFFVKRETIGDLMVTSLAPSWPPIARIVSTLNTCAMRMWGALCDFWLVNNWWPPILNGGDELIRFSPCLLRWTTERSKKLKWINTQAQVEPTHPTHRIEKVWLKSNWHLSESCTDWSCRQSEQYLIKILIL